MTSALRQDYQKIFNKLPYFLQYFELVFILLQLVQILCKLIIIWVNYEKKQKGVLFMNRRVKA